MPQTDNPKPKPPRNWKLRAARKALPSPSGAPGMCMSRRELAEAANAYVWKHTGGQQNTNMTEHDIGRYERGEVHWPRSPWRRYGLRGVLGASSDTELGFYPNRMTSTTDDDLPELGRLSDAVAGAPEAAFLGDGSVVVCAPTRREEVRGRPAISVADNSAAQLVADTARSVGLRTRFELIPDGGDVDLNRANLVVICGPRMSGAVAGILTQDRRFDFFEEDDGPWILRDRVTGVAYRSGQDQDPSRPWDAAYFGRLPRPDGAGTLLLIAGIHPQGSLGIAHLIATRLAGLHKDTAGASFSVLVGTEYDPETGEPTQVNPLTPFCRWDVHLADAGVHGE